MSCVRRYLWPRTAEEIGKDETERAVCMETAAPEPIRMHRPARPSKERIGDKRDYNSLSKLELQAIAESAERRVRTLEKANRAAATALR